MQLETPRMILREWKSQDLDNLIKLNQDPEVMRYFPYLYTPEMTIKHLHSFQEAFNKFGYTMFVCELKATGQFIGFVGILNRSDMPFSPCTEIGWRLDKNYWGIGLAVEAAQKCLELAFEVHSLAEIISFTSKINVPSQRVMQKLGMVYAEDFYHYKFDKTHPLALHVLYKLTKEEWQKTKKLV